MVSKSKCIPCTDLKCSLVVQTTAQEVQVQWVESQWVLEGNTQDRKRGVGMEGGRVGKAVVWNKDLYSCPCVDIETLTMVVCLGLVDLQRRDWSLVAEDMKCSMAQQTFL